MVKVNNLILDALRLNDGSCAKLAQALGVSRQYISNVIHSGDGFCPSSLRDKILSCYPKMIASRSYTHTQFKRKYLTQDNVLRELYGGAK